MSERRQFGADSTTSDVLAGIDLSGKVALVTGGSGGLGEETARAFAEKGVRVVLAARNLTKGEAAAQAIRASTGNHEAEVGELELEFSLSGPDPLPGSTWHPPFRRLRLATSDPADGQRSEPARRLPGQDVDRQRGWV